MILNTERFASRHIGPRKKDLPHMLEVIGVESIDQLIDETVPANIRLSAPLDLPEAVSEYEFSKHIQALGKKNTIAKNYIGLGYHPCIVPAVIQRNVLENPGWYTAYTPYQAEIAQGRLEALLNFQTMVVDLTGMEIANASLLDEATAAAEAMTMLYSVRSRDKQKSNALKFFVDQEVLPQTKSVLQTRAIPLEIELVEGDYRSFKPTNDFFGALLQYPNASGVVEDYTEFSAKLAQHDIKLAVAADILSLVKLMPPGDWGADVVVGTTQRFGIPLGYGGPHAAYFATKEQFKRNIPGRIIGATKDTDGNFALRMALQTREQHIKRDKATSNICTAQVLLAVMAGMYAVYHGPRGLSYIANKVHHSAVSLKQQLEALGYTCLNRSFFDTILITANAEEVKAKAEAKNINFYYPSADCVSIALNETTSIEDLNEIIELFAEIAEKEFTPIKSLITKDCFNPSQARKTDFLTNTVFNLYQSETELMRYIKRLERKDLSLNHSMISLGSCTMKLNAAAEMLPLSTPEWNNIHPFAPIHQVEGYRIMLEDLAQKLNVITGFAATSLQPNSGAQGEYAGLMVIRAYHQSRGESFRNVCLIPSSAHGTNPASAVMAGMQVVVTKSDERGNIDLEDLKEKAEKYKDRLAALMVTYPSTHGVFESTITEITKTIHQYGGQVYMDGANMNAQVGLTNPAKIGADVCHLNLHKTFAIPHGGGGPGVGPICVAAHLAPFLP
ncbi:MAG: aminomethyl-transferring glycine dehydrogenase, partial [Flavobacteriaceae bacterium]|nr:aminomethyl-transferring glycine dehydrogenase [Flavobacteriaceae bacterium]